MNTPIVRREFTVYLDIAARLGPINEAEAEDRWSYCDKRGYLGPATSAQDYARSEQQLLTGLLHNAHALDAWLKQDALICAAHAFDVDGDPSGRQHLGVLAPVIARMAAPDRTVLEDALERGELYECAGPLQMATEVSVTSMSAEALPPAESWAPSSNAVAERRYRVAFRVRAELSPISAHRVLEVLTELKRTSDSPSVSREAYTQIQERLREALIADEAALRAWLEKEALLTIAEGAGEEFLEAASDTATLGPVIAAMDAPDREYFEHAIAAQVLYETASGLYEASRQELQAVEFAHGA